jgi:hypothetical protein
MDGGGDALIKKIHATSKRIELKKKEQRAQPRRKLALRSTIVHRDLHSFPKNNDYIPRLTCK